MINWRRAFFDCALTQANVMYKAYLAQNPNATSSDVRKWANNATDISSGAVFWEIPQSNEVSVSRVS